MPDNYEKLLEKTVTVQEGVLQNLKVLAENTKEMNDNFSTHCVDIKRVREELLIIKTLLINYLKWAILSLVVVLGGKSIVEIILANL